MNTTYIEPPIDSLLVLFIALIVFGPIIWVLLSSRSHGGAKFGWAFVVFLFSWLGFAIFLIVTQPAKDTPKKNSFSVVKTGLLVSALLFLISLSLLLLTEPYSISRTKPGSWVILSYKALRILSWPMKPLHWPLGTWPLISLIQGFLFAFFIKIFKIIRGSENVAA